uniref:Uncharacterized protein n=1 Tax=Oryzias sinensis TaxID=183150 RepID=A0A8C7Y7C0_9TELE
MYLDRPSTKAEMTLPKADRERFILVPSLSRSPVAPESGHSVRQGLRLITCGSCFLFIHPSSSAYPGPGRGGSSLSRDAQTSLTPATSSSSSGGTPRRSQASRETWSPVCPGSSPRPPPSGRTPS